MPVGASVNAIKSFRFVDLVKTEAARGTIESTVSGRERTRQNYQKSRIQPREVSNKASRTSIQVQENLSIHDRFIDIII